MKKIILIMYLGLFINFVYSSDVVDDAIDTLEDIKKSSDIDMPFLESKSDQTSQETSFSSQEEKDQEEMYIPLRDVCKINLEKGQSKIIYVIEKPQLNKQSKYFIDPWVFKARISDKLSFLGGRTLTIINPVMDDNKFPIEDFLECNGPIRMITKHDYNNLYAALYE